MTKLPWKNNYFLSLLSLAGAWGFQWMLKNATSPLSYTNSITAFFLFSFWFYALHKVTAKKDFNQMQAIFTPCALFLFCFSGSMIAGAQLDQTGNVDFSDFRLYAAAVFVAVAAAPILAFVLRKLEAFSLKRPAADSHPKNALSPRMSFWLTFGILFLSYIPTLLAAFPGFFTYDAMAETYMVFKDKYSTYQPLFHVVLLGWTLRAVYFLTHSYNMGILLYILAQMAVMSACFSYEITFLRRCNVKTWICNLGTAFLALFPTVSMFVCCSTKDTLFSGGIILFTTLLLELVKEGELFWHAKHKKLLFSCAMLFILFFRNNGIYALVVFFFFFVIVYRRSWKKWLPTVACTFLIYFVVTQALFFSFHAKKGPIAEMFCVPMQQLARVYFQVGDELSAEDTEVLSNLLPPQIILDQYTPKLADMVKGYFGEDYLRAFPQKCISLWFRLGVKYFDIYLNSFLANTYGYWYPDTVPDGYRGIWIADRPYEDSSYFAFVTEYPGQRTSLLPPLERFYEKISLEIYQQKAPVLSMLFSIGFWHWIYCFTALYLLICGYKKQAFSLSLIGLVYLTVLLGPIALVRYALYLFFAVPLVLALLFDPKAFAQ